MKAQAQVSNYVERYPINLDATAPTERWLAELWLLNSDTGPDGRSVDSAAWVVVGDLECAGGVANPGAADLAASLASRIATPLGLIVGRVCRQRDIEVPAEF